MIPVILDTETALIAPRRQAPLLACVAVQSQCLGIRELLHWTGYNDLVTQLLEDTDIRIIGHTVSFDMAVFAADDLSLLPLIFKAYNEDRIVCTEARAKLLDIAAGTMRFHNEGKTKYSLESLAKRHLNRTLDKDTWRLRYGELRPYPLSQWPEGAKLYPLDDTRATEDLYYLQDAPENQRFLEDQYRQSRAAFWIKLMSVWGIHTDAQGVWELAEQTGQEYERIAKDLRAVGLVRGDKTVKRRTGIVETVKGSRDTKAAGLRIMQAYNKLGKTCPMTERGMQPALDEQACIDSGDPVLVDYARLTSIGNILSKDLKFLEDGITVPIHSFFDFLKETGRTGSAKPNIQNLRRAPGIRECFVPRCLTCGRVHTVDDANAGYCLRCGGPVCVYVGADYSGLELATQGQMLMTIVGWSSLAQAINAGKDPHLLLSEQLLCRPYEELERIKEAGAQGDCISKSGTVCQCAYCIVDNARQTSKVGNFGFAGGLGAKTLVFFALTQYGVRLTKQEAKRLKQHWITTWPEFRDYFKYVDWHTKQNPPRIEQLFSKRFRCGSYTELCNTIFQGLGADIGKAAGWELAQGQYLPDYNPPLFGTRTNNFVHDDFLIECPEFRAHEAAIALGDVMVSAAKPWLPDVKIGCKPYITRRMSRKAKPVWKEGRLVPWG